MTSSNPPQSLRHPSSPLPSRTGTISPRGLAHLPPSSRFPSHLPLEPFHTTSVSLVLLHARARPPPTCILSSCSLPPRPPVRPRYPPPSSAYPGDPLSCVRLSSCHLLLRPSFFHFPPFVPTNYRRARFRWIKAAMGLLSTFCSTDQMPRTRIPTNRNANGLRYRRAAQRG